MVRFFALLRIKPHAPPLVRVPVNSFEFQPCGRLRMGFSLLRFVTKCTVRSYRTFSPLPVLPEGNHRRYCFLFHFPSRCRARPLAGILLCGARTFLPVCLTRYAATVCSKPPSPPVFLHISTHFTATHGIPLSPSALKLNSFQSVLWLSHSL